MVLNCSEENFGFLIGMRVPLAMTGKDQGLFFFLMCYLNLFLFDCRITALQHCVGITVLTKHQHESAIGYLMSSPS